MPDPNRSYGFLESRHTVVTGRRCLGARLPHMGPLAHVDCSVDRLELRSVDADAVKNAGKNLAGINRQAIDTVAVVPDDIANI